MLRQLLTVLAILTGLAAFGAPAQAAQVNEVASISLVATTQAAAKCTLPSSGPALAAPAVAREGLSAPCPKPKPTVVLPPVMLRADRALE